jgi:hypothetical protein
MATRFSINQDLLSQAGRALSAHERLYWIIGGAGSGKSSVCRALTARYGIPVYDMDAHIYGSYHSRFTQERHPANWAWARAENGLAWLLEMSWEEFDNFNQVALPEYLDLLASDLREVPPSSGILIDGGVCNPAVLAKAVPSRQMVCLAAPSGTSARLWQDSEERRGMKAAIDQLPQPRTAWRKFLEFDQRINVTILKECLENDIPVCLKGEKEPIEELAEWVVERLAIGD